MGAISFLSAREPKELNTHQVCERRRKGVQYPFLNEIQYFSKKSLKDANICLKRRKNGDEEN
jgi:hypothetical protein